MPPEDIPEDRELSFPCECGGSITLMDGLWSCDKCKTTLVDDGNHT